MFPNIKTKNHPLRAITNLISPSNTSSEAKTHLSNHKQSSLGNELENFVYIASHDLKAPLRAIDNIASWLAEDLKVVMKHETREHIRLLRSRVSRMEDLLNSLLTYARIGKDNIKLEKVNINDLVEEIILLLNPPETVSIKKTMEMPTFKTLKTPLLQVFMNLIGNAIKHNHQQNLTIELSFTDLGEFYKFTVRDNGPGIPEELQEKAFQAFQTLKPKDTVEGSGMGLAIVKKAVEEIGGTIELNSAQDQGSEFTFTWPKNIKRD